MRRIATVAAVALLAALLPIAPVSADTPVPSLPDSQQGCLPPPSISDAQVPWAQQQLAPQNVWPLTNGTNVTVGVVDTGVDARSPQLAGHVLAGKDVVDPGGGAGDVDCFGHGTFVAGIIAAAPAVGTGFAGVAPGVQIMPIRIADNDSDVTSTAMATGIRTAVDDGASVINISASTSVQDPNLAAAVAYAEASNVVIVASAGNDATNGDPVTYPAAYPTVLAVGAIDSTGALASFSEIGPYVGLVAPGMNVVSIGPGGPGQWQGSGTSYASPFVTAVAALVRAYHPNLTAAQVRHRLEETADHPAATLPDPQYGWGVVNPMAAVSEVLPNEGTTASPVVGATAARPPVVPVRDQTGPLIAVLGAMGAFFILCVLMLFRRVGVFGNRRRWRPGRVAVFGKIAPNQQVPADTDAPTDMDSSSPTRRIGPQPLCHGESFDRSASAGRKAANPL